MQSSERPSERKIAMWGAPATGKTTFLAALNIALLRNEQHHAPQWRVMGHDPDSAHSLARLTEALVADRVFPVATGDVQHYRWALVGPVQRDARRWWHGRRESSEATRIELDLIDAPGAIARPDSRGDGDPIEGLVRSSAIVFLYDPVREFESGDAFRYTAEVLTEMSGRVSSPDGKLPHYVAVCITKFDDVRVLATAEKLDVLVTDPDPPGFPRVADENAREFFLELSNVSRSGLAREIPALLERTFHADRIRYFATSAIGFYVNAETASTIPRTSRITFQEYKANASGDPSVPLRFSQQG